ncbi:acyltransferase [bacterium]|nr:acyltransferase [candidate division CSSED10-310 bacterium]
MSHEPREESKTELQSQLTNQKISALKKYQMMTIGRSGLWRLIKYELIMLICNRCSGALGYFLRKILYPRLLGHVGKGTVFGRDMTLRHPHKIRVGDHCVFDDLVVLDAKGETNQGITIGDNVIIARNTVISCKNGNITIGDNSNISLNCMIHSEKNVVIGPKNLWAAYCYIIGGGKHNFDRIDMPIIQQGSQVDGIQMSEDIWLGARVTIFDGCSIGKGVVIGAGSLVNKDIPDYKIAAGVPVKIIKDRAGQKGNESPSESSQT